MRHKILSSVVSYNNRILEIKKKEMKKLNVFTKIKIINLKNKRSSGFKKNLIKEKFRSLRIDRKQRK